MSSPFPGMDPYLEDHIWSDVHHGLAFVFKEQLVPQVKPEYFVRINVQTFKDTETEEDIGIMYPDVEVFKKGANIVSEPAASYIGSSVTPATLTLSVAPFPELKIPELEIRDRKNNKLITTCEIISPVDKRGIGLKQYQEKRERLLSESVHLIEIDLIRRGRRALEHLSIPKSHYLVLVTNFHTGKTNVWTVDITDKLPVVPVPLAKPEQHAQLDIGKGLQDLYERSDYGASINYEKEPPPPKFSKEEKQWIKEVIKKET